MRTNVQIDDAVVRGGAVAAGLTTMCAALFAFARAIIRVAHIADDIRRLRMDVLYLKAVSDNVSTKDRLQACQEYMDLGGNGAIKVLHKHLCEQYEHESCL